ncbi:TIGR04282 family arsenosugar biosynthesis glycosyltransferase [Kutzneria kofuensis]|uniref:Glycosyltransferase involved in cell wall biogenesis n=1 Tax=Kutzneria kofuensis TaxID=103725 RepID=A0A7W9KGF7_9PSEU|nr:DUF2064 domain-containing protein [Kutzneria kofuensis]MBB5891970.1 hypothetical protein [Kutzneria kofuensis]
MTDRACVLVVAKAPVSGLAKTRLTPAATPEQAAEVAAASLLDTLDAVLSVPRVRRVVAMTGDLEKAARSAELRRMLRWFDVIPQRGNDFAERLANAHHDVADLPVVQIGMDTPQVTPWLLGSAVVSTLAGDAALGLAEDGGWWALGLKDPLHAMALRRVPMSQPDTGSRTLDALHDLDLQVSPLPVLSDVDTIEDARRVAALLPRSRFAAAVSVVRQPVS